jgi:putative tricarboxylic transport membrane protein
MPRRNVTCSIILMALAMVAILESIQLPFGTLRSPQPGFWPLILSMILAFFSLIHLGNSIKARGKEKGPFWAQSGGWKRIGMAVGALVAFGFLFEPLGYLVSVFLLIGFLLRVIEPMRWWLMITIALLSSVLSYLLFGVLLSTPLPAGLLNL